MKIIIEHSQTKREITGAFNICGTAEDLRKIARQIAEVVNDNRFNYGWVHIVPEKQSAIPDTPLAKWDVG